MPPRESTTASATASKMKDPSSQKAPWLLLQWSKLYQAVPKIHVPFTDLDISITILAVLLLIVVRFTGERALVDYFGWPSDGSLVTKEAAGSIAAIAHSLTLVPALCVALWTQPYKPSSTMDSHPQWWQDAVVSLLQLCTGYMIYDSIFSFVILRWEEGVGPVLSASDWMFLGHHFATAFYMTSTRVISAGHISAMACMTIGEATNPFHNAYLITEQAIQLFPNNGTAVAAHDAIEFLFALLYCLARIVIGPLAMLHVSYDVALSASGRKHIPLFLTILWLVMIWGVVFGSLPWIQECWGMLEKRFVIMQDAKQEL